MTSSTNATDLSGKVAVVTGAAAGLGRAEAIGLARLGATVVVNDIAPALDASDVIDEISAAGIREVVFFHSQADELREHTAGLPFAMIADPTKRFYREFGVESGPRAVLDPRVWGAIIRGKRLIARGRYRAPAVKQEGGHLGLPADFLVDSQGAVIAAKYGKHADDQWSVDELLANARDAARR